MGTDNLVPDRMYSVSPKDPSVSVGGLSVPAALNDVAICVVSNVNVNSTVRSVMGI